MPIELSHGTPLHISTRDLPVSQRIPFWREVFAKQALHLDIEVPAGTPLEAESTLIALPAVRLLWCETHTPSLWRRASTDLQDGDNDVVLLLSTHGSATRSQRGRELEVETGEAVCILQSEAASLRFRKLGHLAVIVPRATLQPLVPDVERASRHLVRRGTEALRLLRNYLEMLRSSGVTDPLLHKAVAEHIGDLVALSVGANRDGDHLARQRGLRAARLCSLKAAIAEDPDLHITELAERQGVSERYVQMLFEEDGTTFTSHVTELRLGCAREMLSDARYDHWTIAAIALQAGFGDVSHFNRKFKQRFGLTPRDARAGARSRG